MLPGAFALLAVLSHAHLGVSTVFSTLDITHVIKLTTLDGAWERGYIYTYVRQFLNSVRVCMSLPGQLLASFDVLSNLQHTMCRGSLAYYYHINRGNRSV